MYGIYISKDGDKWLAQYSKAKLFGDLMQGDIVFADTKEDAVSKLLEKLPDKLFIRDDQN